MKNDILKRITVYGDLTKYKLSLAVVLSSITGYFLYRNTIDLHLLFLACGIFLLASGSAALNQYTERVADSIMKRTENRPIPSKKISEKKAIVLSIVLLISGSIFLTMNGFIPAILGVFNVLLYNLLYTRLKKKTPLSIVPGALVGAIPPMIGFSSAGGPLIHQANIIFATFMFLWQIPHFWLIIIKYGKEYKAAGFATISKYLSEIQIRYLVFFWVIISTLFLFLFFSLAENIKNDMFFILIIINILFIIIFFRLLFLKTKPQEVKGAFILINSFSFVLMFLIIVISIFKGI